MKIFLETILYQIISVIYNQDPRQFLRGFIRGFLIDNKDILISITEDMDESEKISTKILLVQLGIISPSELQVSDELKENIAKYHKMIEGEKEVEKV